MNTNRLWPATALPLLVFWTLFCGSGTWRGVAGNYKTLTVCEAMGAKEVESADARRAEFVAAKAAMQRSHPGKAVVSTEDYNVQWECQPSDGSTPTYGGYGKTKKPRSPP
jgi:hypothetical protein